MIVSVSALSPAKNNVFSELVSYLLINSPLGSLRFIALNAVGAVNNIFTSCSSIIRQKVPGSGVPIGFPSNNNVVFPAKRGA